MIPFNPRVMAEAYGIHLPGVQGIWEESDRREADLAVDNAILMDKMGADAQPTMFTALNAGIPAWMTNFIDPDTIRVLTTPMRAAEIMGGEVLKGDWTDATGQFPMVEATGMTSGYGDWNNNGTVGTNNQWETRGSFLFQTIAQWGELQMARAGRARISYVSDLNFSAAVVMNKFQNKSYFYGVASVALNYGLFNDPSLPASITPITKAAGGTTWAVATSAEIYTDVVDLYAQLVAQSAGIIEKDTPMVLAMSPANEAAIAKTNMYNVNVMDQVKKNFPNMEVKSAVEYATQAGNLVQLIAKTVDGQRVAIPAYNEKMRAHPIKVGLSNFAQKKTSGTWGTVIRIPFAIASMLGT